MSWKQAVAILCGAKYQAFCLGLAATVCYGTAIRERRVLPAAAFIAWIPMSIDIEGAD
jgi:hypothetical protein